MGDALSVTKHSQEGGAGDTNFVTERPALGSKFRAIKQEVGYCLRRLAAETKHRVSGTNFLQESVEHEGHMPLEKLCHNDDGVQKILFNIM